MIDSNIAIGVGAGGAKKSDNAAKHLEGEGVTLPPATERASTVVPERKTLRRTRLLSGSRGAIGGIIGGLIGASAALIAAYYAYYQTERVSRESSYVSFIQSRIEGCIALSSHHRNAAERDDAEESVETPLLTLEDGSEVFMTGNRDRHRVSIGMARKLLLCMAVKDVQYLRDCVGEISDHGSVYVYDYVGTDTTIYGREPGEDEIFQGRKNIVC